MTCGQGVQAAGLSINNTHRETRHETEVSTDRRDRGHALMAGQAVAEMKVGMITTLSGGGAGLGIDVRDGFLLALKQAGDAGARSRS
jgi:hypothetical protein